MEDRSPPSIAGAAINTWLEMTKRRRFERRRDFVWRWLVKRSPTSSNNLQLKTLQHGRFHHFNTLPLIQTMIQIYSTLNPELPKNEHPWSHHIPSSYTHAILCPSCSHLSHGQSHRSAGWRSRPERQHGTAELSLSNCLIFKLYRWIQTI